MKKCIQFLSVFLLVFCLDGCQQKQAKVISDSNNAISVIDSRGVQVVLDQPAQRVVVLYEAFVDAVFMLQAQDKLVGVPEQVFITPNSYEFFSSLSDSFKEKNIETPTFNGRTVNMETLIGLNPDLVITFGQDLDQINQMESLGLKVYTVIGTNIETTLKEFEDMGILVGQKSRAQKIVSYIKNEVEQMQSFTADYKKTVYYCWSKGRVLSTSGKGTLMDSAITLAGAKNACPLEMDNPNIGVELLYQWNPDIMVLWNTPVSDVYNMKELAKLPAVTQQHVYELSPTFLFDPHTVKLFLFSKRIHQWCYPDVYSQEELDRDIKQAMQVLYN